MIDLIIEGGALPAPFGQVVELNLCMSPRQNAHVSNAMPLRPPLRPPMTTTITHSRILIAGLATIRRSSTRSRGGSSSSSNSAGSGTSTCSSSSILTSRCRGSSNRTGSSPLFIQPIDSMVNNNAGRPPARTKCSRSRRRSNGSNRTSTRGSKPRRTRHSSCRSSGRCKM